MKCSKCQYENNADPFYTEYGRSFLGRLYILNNQMDEAERSFRRTLKFAENFGIKTIEAVSQVFLGVIQIAKKQMSAGLKLLNKAKHTFEECEMEGFLKEAKDALGSLKGLKGGRGAGEPVK